VFDPTGLPRPPAALVLLACVALLGVVVLVGGFDADFEQASGSPIIQQQTSSLRSAMYI